MRIRKRRKTIVYVSGQLICLNSLSDKLPFPRKILGEVLKREAKKEDNVSQLPAVSKQGKLQPRCHPKARSLSRQL